MQSKKGKVKDLLGYSCRACINAQCHVQLTRRDCLYLRIPRECSLCHATKNIVAELTLQGRLHTLFH